MELELRDLTHLQQACLRQMDTASFGLGPEIPLPRSAMSAAGDHPAVPFLPPSASADMSVPSRPQGPQTGRPVAVRPSGAPLRRFDASVSDNSTSESAGDAASAAASGSVSALAAFAVSSPARNGPLDEQRVDYDDTATGAQQRQQQQQQQGRPAWAQYYASPAAPPSEQGALTPVSAALYVFLLSHAFAAPRFSLSLPLCICSLPEL